MNPILHIVHTIDTEGPLDEDLQATFARINQLFGLSLKPSRQLLRQLQYKEIDLGDCLESEVAKVFSPDLLAYNRSWPDIQSMLDEALSKEFRRKTVDDFDGGWVYSWHCVDHMGFQSNPRHKDMGYGNIFEFYKQAIQETNSIQDEINWHFHPLSIRRDPLSAATSFVNSMPLILELWCRRIIENDWFPTTNRPGFHSERSDANLFLEQWLPFDYANQSIDEVEHRQQDTSFGRFGDWSRAPRNWIGYHPSAHDYQTPGECRRWIFRCLNLGTRFRNLRSEHIKEAFSDAREHGSAIIAFADHDYRDLRKDVEEFRELLAQVRNQNEDVKIKFSGAHAAATEHIQRLEPNLPAEKPEFDIALHDNRIFVEMKSGSLQGAQPFLAIRAKTGEYFHDNFDILKPDNRWTYIFDEQTIELKSVDVIGVGGAGRFGHSCVKKIKLS